MSSEFDRGHADAMAERLRALAQPQRLMILSLLLDGERAVGDIEAVTGIGQPALSQQLAELRRAGLVATRRDTRMIFYRIADEKAEDRVRALFVVFGAERPPGRAKRAVSPRRRSDAGLIGAASFARVG